MGDGRQVSVQCEEAVDLDAMARVGNVWHCCFCGQKVERWTASCHKSSRSRSPRSTERVKHISSQEFCGPRKSINSLLHNHGRLSVPYRFAGVPTIVLSADSSRQKRETFRGSEFASRVLAENGFPIAMKVSLRTLI